MERTQYSLEKHYAETKRGLLDLLRERADLTEIENPRENYEVVTVARSEKEGVQKFLRFSVWNNWSYWEVKNGKLEDYNKWLSSSRRPVLQTYASIKGISFDPSQTFAAFIKDLQSIIRRLKATR